MISGTQLRDARSRAGLTQEQLAQRLGVTLRSVGNWERSVVPPNREAPVRDALAAQLASEDRPALEEASDVALLAEIGRRLAQRRTGGSDAGKSRQKMSEDVGGNYTPGTPGPASRVEQGSVSGASSPEGGGGPSPAARKGRKSRN